MSGRGRGGFRGGFRGGGASAAGGGRGGGGGGGWKNQVMRASSIDNDGDDDEKGSKNKYKDAEDGYERPSDWDKDDWKADPLERAKKEDDLDAVFGFVRVSPSEQKQTKLAWLINMHPGVTEDKDTHKVQQCLNLYFMEMDGNTFKTSIPHNPYFYLGAKEGRFREVEAFLRRKFERSIEDIRPEEKIDLDMKNHLSGLKKTFIRVEFATVSDLVAVKAQLMPIVAENKQRQEVGAAYDDEDDMDDSERRNYSDYIEDMREYDVPYYERVSIDTGLRVGFWYDVTFHEGKVSVEQKKDLMTRAQPKVLAFDIETTKMPMRFPDPKIDQVMMISYMIDGQGYLITNRSIVGEDIEDFEYNPKPEFKGPFKVFNEPTEAKLISRWIEHMKAEKPNIWVTFHGDGFDWYFMEARAKTLGMPLSTHLGLRYDKQGEYYCTPYAPHLDCLRWVIRDSYLPHGSHGLKAVTRSKLGYNPLEIDPEEMLRYAKEKPQAMASYSVSDAVATYYLYHRYIHPFVFSLCTIIPMHPDDVLRKGSGTLCESLLMVEAFKGQIIFPNKKGQPFGKMYEGHFIESETYVGGHVEALETGVYRSDLETKFELNADEIQRLIDDLDKALEFALVEEAKVTRADVTNYDQVKSAIQAKLERLRDNASLSETPLIYHLDVAAMYPNLILTNRLQPVAMVNDMICSSCIFNQPENKCKRRMEWQWRLEYLPATRSEYEHVKSQLELETFTTVIDGREQNVTFYALPVLERNNKLKARLKEYCKNVYKKTKATTTVLRKDTICMRENPFYVDTVRAFRDRRYDYKNATKTWSKNLDLAKKKNSADEIYEATNMLVTMDSLQLAHKCILNSFYGYVMRKGARWHSMEMAGIVTHTGAHIIKKSRELIECVGKPLELDTDGIWCCLPKSFPENFEFKLSTERKSFTFSYICTALNTRVHQDFTNPQYQTLKDPKTLEYETKTECSIFFEVDGPYRAMVLPTSEQEGKQLKKRYAVFTKEGTLAELKGFEIKRRGELKMIKDFQSQIFGSFLAGSTLEECYDTVAKVAAHYLDVIDTKGESMDDVELLELISESRNMSKNLDEYGTQKSAAITTLKRLSELIGDHSVKEAGISCRFVIAKKPEGEQVTQRAIPLEVFASNSTIQQRFIRKWLNDPGLLDCSLRSIVDWEYYRGRITSQIHKLITLPAFYQGVRNPLPRVQPPEWLAKKLKLQTEGKKQLKIKDLFAVRDAHPAQPASLSLADESMDVDTLSNLQARHVADMEDMVLPEGHGNAAASRSTGASLDVDAPATTSTASTSAGGKGGPRQTTLPFGNSRKRNRNAYDAFHGPDYSSLGPCPDEKTDYVGCLRWRKKKWALQREARKKRKAEFGENAPPQKRANTIGAMFSQQNLSLLTNNWHILQINEQPGKPGVLQLWLALEDDTMHSVELHVDRKVYLNSYVNKGDNLKQSRGFLPRARQRQYLYEMEVSERVFQLERATIEQQKNDTDLEGFYESKVPLVFRAVMELGNVVRVRHESRGHPLSQPWELKHLQMQSATDKYPYLGPKPKFFFVYQCGTASRGLFVVYFAPTNACHFIYVAQTPQEDILSHLRKLDLFTKADAACTVNRVTSVETACVEIEKLVAESRISIKGPIVAILQCGGHRGAEIATLVPSLSTVPVIKNPSIENDNNLQALGWLPEAAERGFTRAISMIGWWKSTVGLARYSQVPIANFADNIVLMNDMHYARRLKQHDMVLWYSEDGRPDLGGNEDADAVFNIETVNPEKAYPDCMETIAIEISLSGLPVNTLIQSSHIPDLESSLLAIDTTTAGAAAGAASTEGENALNRNIYDETVACARAFKVLKNLVTTWSVDATVSEKPIFAAETLVLNFYRWITNPQSKLYDPALHKLVQKLIKKVFLQMLAEFKKLGARVIYASVQKIIIATDKKTLKEAESYFSFLRKTFRKNRELFRYIKLQATNYYDILLFKDPYNYVAIDAKSGQFDHCLHVADYLPQSIRRHFEVTVFAFVRELQRHKQTALALMDPAEQAVALAQAAHPNGQAANENDEQGSDLIAEWHKEDDATAHSRALSASSAGVGSKSLGGLGGAGRSLFSKLSERLYKTVEDVRLQLSSADVQAQLVQLKFIVHPEFKYDNPALEFVKVTCYMMSLKKSLQHEIQTLKRTLLKGLGVHEFAPEAEFSDPCVSYILPNVICHFCNSVRDLDMLRDPLLLANDWQCPYCRMLVEKRQIERRLVDIVERRSMAYQMQDLKCVKCSQVKADFAATICSQCSGGLTCKTDAATFRTSMLVFWNVARLHQFEWLQDVVEFLLQVKKGQ